MSEKTDADRAAFFRLLDDHVTELRLKGVQPDGASEDARLKMIQALTDPARRDRIYQWFLDSDLGPRRTRP